MGRLSIVTSLFVLLLSTATAPLAYAAPKPPKACSEDTANLVVNIPFLSVDPQTDQETFMVGSMIDGVAGTINPSEAPTITLKDGKTSFTLACKDGGSSAGTTTTHIYGCTLPSADKATTTTTKFDIQFSTKIQDTSCLYTGTINFKDASTLSPHQLSVEHDESCEDAAAACAVQGFFAAFRVVFHDLAYNIDGDDLPVADDKCPYATGEDDCTEDDIDGDGITNDEDNCTPIPNPNQEDLDEDGSGDVCDQDRDGDKDQNTDDNCPSVANKDQKDTDNDGLGDACDDGKTPIPCKTDTMICTTVPGTYCDPVFKQCLPMLDTDGDGTPDIVDECPNTGTELDPCGTALPAIVPPPPSGPATGSADGGGGCSLQTSAPEHSTGVYLLLSFIAVLSALGITRTCLINKERQ